MSRPDEDASQDGAQLGLHVVDHGITYVRVVLTRMGTELQTEKMFGKIISNSHALYKLRPSDAIKHQRSWSTLVQLMAWCRQV